jgi:small subunit ribosomal protein S21
MTEIRIKADESFEAALKKFMKKCTEDGIIQEVKRRQAFEKPSDVKRKNKAVIKARQRKEKKKMDEYLQYLSENKFPPRKKRPQNGKPVEKKSYDRPKVQQKPIVQKTPEKVPEPSVSAESLKQLQDKFK